MDKIYRSIRVKKYFLFIIIKLYSNVDYKHYYLSTFKDKVVTIIRYRAIV